MCSGAISIGHETEPIQVFSAAGPQGSIYESMERWATLYHGVKRGTSA